MAAGKPKPVFPGGYEPPGLQRSEYAYQSELPGLTPLDVVKGEVAREAGRGVSQAGHEGGYWEDDIWYPDPAVVTEDALCSRCDGTGHDWTTDDICPRCEGTGVAPGRVPWWEDANRGSQSAADWAQRIDCGRCQGLGEHPEGQVCTRCGGTGDAPSAHYSPSGSGWTATTAAAPAKPKKKTWRDWPWDGDRSTKAAVSKNVFVRTYGLARDVMTGYWSCPVARHWGPRGGAGVIPFAVMDGHPVVLLSHRGNFVEQPGTWSSFGGAIDAQDKTPFAGAVREMFEEVAGLPTKGSVVASFERPCHACGWTYHTYVIKVQGTPAELIKSVGVRKGASAWETQGVAWVPLWMVQHYDLHPGFAKTWPEAKAAIEASMKGVIVK